MKRALITGADGHVGRAVAHWLLDHSDRELLLYVRDGDTAQRGDKVTRLGGLAADPRCEVVFGDIADKRAFAMIAADGIDGIIHSAAVTDFSIDRETARTVNVDGTARVVEFARSCPNLQQLGFVSSLYAAGLRDGNVDEAPLSRPGRFANHYEWSKWRAEQLLVENPDIPWQIYRVATIVGDNAAGEITQQNVIHNTLRLLFYGLLSVIPGDPATRVYVASTDYVAQAIGRLFTNPESAGIYHLSSSGDDTVTLDAMTRAVYDVFLGDESFARQRILQPVFCDQASFDTLAGSAGQFGSTVEQALDSVVPFAPQLYSDKNVSVRRTVQALGEPAMTNVGKLLAAVATNLVTNRWGRKTDGRGAA